MILHEQPKVITVPILWINPADKAGLVAGKYLDHGSIEENTHAERLTWFEGQRYDLIIGVYIAEEIRPQSFQPPTFQ